MLRNSDGKGMYDYHIPGFNEAAALMLRNWPAHNLLIYKLH